MQNIKKEAPGVYDAFFQLIKAIDESSPIDLKTKELILIGIFTAHNASRGIDTHTHRALKEGAVKSEIVSAIMYALPVTGISSVTAALRIALEIIEEENNKNK